LDLPSAKYCWSLSSLILETKGIVSNKTLPGIENIEFIKWRKIHGASYILIDLSDILLKAVKSIEISRMQKLGFISDRDLHNAR